MTHGKRLRIFIVALFAIFAGRSTWCYGTDDCGCEISCPNTVPPCVEVTFSEIQKPDGHPEYPDVNGEYILKHTPVLGGPCMWNQYGTSSSGARAYWFDVETVSTAQLSHSDPDYGVIFFDFTYSACIASFTNNITDPSRYHGGTASVEFVWDCNDCNNCTTLDINVSDYKNPIDYGNKDCCPVGKGEPEPITFSCDDAYSVIPFYKIEVDPNDSGAWLEVDSSELVSVILDPNDCSVGDSVTFKIQAGQGHPPAKAKVTCTAAFYTATGDTKSKTVTVNVEPSCGPCCDPPFTCPVPIL